MAGRQKSSQTRWYIGDLEESLQFFKEEKTVDAVYNIYLKKVRYHTSLEDDHSFEVASTFYLDVDKKKETAKLQWRLEEIKTIKYGTVEKLVEALVPSSHDFDDSFVNAFFATYRTFSTSNEIMNLILNRYKDCAADMSLKQNIKANQLRIFRTVLFLWIDKYVEDFCDPPTYSTLRELHQFTKDYMPDSELLVRLRNIISMFLKKDEEKSLSSDFEDIHLDFDPIRSPSSHDGLSFPGCNILSFDRSRDLDQISCREFAEQLTYVDAELFKKVRSYQCIGGIWSKRRDKNLNRLVETVRVTVNQFNSVSYRVIATILKNLDLTEDQRAKIIERWIDIAQELRFLKNFSSLKAIVAGLQSNSIYRLKNVWASVSKFKKSVFKEMSELVSEENNQEMAREVLNREGTAKSADPETMNTIRRHRKTQSVVGIGVAVAVGVGLVCQPLSQQSNATTTFDSGSLRRTCGTVPYLGTFLTDLTMIDTAFPDFVESGRLINFEKKKKEFEILMQIQLLQAAANSYEIRPDLSFYQCFMGFRVYDDNESYELSCEIEPENNTTKTSNSLHRRRSSLGYFAANHRSSIITLDEQTPDVKSSSKSDEDVDGFSVNSFKVPRQKLSKRNSTSFSSLRSLPVRPRPSLPTSASSSSTLSSLLSSNAVVARVYLETTDNHSTNLYKSITLSNADHTETVIENALRKYNYFHQQKINDFLLFQTLPDGSENQVPEKTNVFYAINANVPQVHLVIRKKYDLQRQSKGNAKYRIKDKRNSIIFPAF